MSDLTVLADYDCGADPSLTQLLSTPTMHNGLFMGDNSETSTAEYNGISSSAQLDHEGTCSLVPGQTDGCRTMSDLTVAADYDCDADPSLTQLLSTPTTHDGLFMGDKSDTSTAEYNGVLSSAQLDHKGSLVPGQIDGYHSTSKPKPQESPLENGFEINDVVHDRLDTSLYGLPKDTYIKTLIEMTSHCDETISRYRSVLSNKCKQLPNAPIGILKERRKSVRGSVADKYALDCYKLSQFLQQNVQEVSEVYRKQPFLQNSQPDSQTIVSHSETALLKETIAIMQSDIVILKRNEAICKQTLEKLSPQPCHTTQTTNTRNTKSWKHACRQSKILRKKAMTPLLTY